MPKLSAEQRRNAIRKLDNILSGTGTIGLPALGHRGMNAAIQEDSDTSDLRAFAEVCRAAATLADALAVRDGDCEFTHRPSILGGRPRVAAQCTTCGVPLGAWTIEEAHANFERHKAIPAPPADVLARPITKTDIQAYPEYFIEGRGRAVASATECPHAYHLTDSCPGCDAEE